jgi:hypothetical protein
MSEQAPVTIRKIEIADAQFRTEGTVLDGAQIRNLALGRRIRRRRLKAAGMIAVALAMVAAVAMPTSHKPDRKLTIRDNPSAIITPDSGKEVNLPNPEADIVQIQLLRQQSSRLQERLELLEAERIVLDLEKELAFRIRFPESLETIAVRNYAAQQFLSTITQSNVDSPQLASRRLQDVVAYFPETIAATKAAELIH